MEDERHIFCLFKLNSRESNTRAESNYDFPIIEITTDESLALTCNNESVCESCVLVEQLVKSECDVNEMNYTKLSVIITHLMLERERAARPDQMISFIHRYYTFTPIHSNRPFFRTMKRIEKRTEGREGDGEEEKGRK